MGCTVTWPGTPSELFRPGRVGLVSADRAGDRVRAVAGVAASAGAWLGHGHAWPRAELGPEQLNSEHPQVVLRGRARRHDGHWLVSLFLVNAQPRPSTHAGHGMAVPGATRGDRTGSQAPVFLPRPESISGGDQADKAEQRRLAMAYRKCPEFAVGHGTGVHAVCADGDPMRAVEIARRPCRPTRSRSPMCRAGHGPRPALARRTRARHAAAGRAGVPDLVAGLTPLAAGYRTWISEQEAPDRRSGEPPDRLRARTRPTLWPPRGGPRTGSRPGSGFCRRTRSALAAFRFANQAMYLQRVHTLAAEARHRDDAPQPG